MFWNYTQPVTIRFGNGRISELGKEILGLGGNRGILQELIMDINPLIKVTYGKVSPNPDISECEDCVRLIRENQCDFVVALGGGSVLDCAKAAAVFAKGNQPPRDYLHDGAALPTTRLPLIAVPTTAGTGSEISSVTILSDHTKGIKKPLAGIRHLKRASLQSIGARRQPKLQDTLCRTRCTWLAIQNRKKANHRRSAYLKSQTTQTKRGASSSPFSSILTGD